MKEQTQQDFLRNAKDETGLDWDALAALAGIHPRAFKTYRMPDTSRDFRFMNGLAKNALSRALEDFRNKHNKKI